MSHPFHHAVSSAKQFGGKPEDYQAIHDWFDATKAHCPDARHRALRHHSEGIFLCEQVFGVTITNSSGRQIPVRLIGEQHVKEDCCGVIPTAMDWLKHMTIEPWMHRGAEIPGVTGPKRTGLSLLEHQGRQAQLADQIHSPAPGGDLRDALRTWQ